MKGEAKLKKKLKGKLNKNKKSLGTVIVFSMLVCLLLSNLLIAISSYSITKKELVSSAYTNISSIIDAVAMDVDATNEGYFDSLEILSQVQLFRDTKNTLRQKTYWLKEISALNEAFDNMMFIDIKGRAYDENCKIRDDSRAPYFTNAIKGNRYIVDPTLYGNQLLMIYSVPVYDFNSEICGVLCGIIQSETLTHTVEGLVVGNGNHPFIINMNTGVVVADVTFDNVKRGANVVKNSTGKMHDLLLEACDGERGAGEVSFPGFGEMYMSYRPVGGSCSWAIVCYAPQTDFIGGLSEGRFNVLLSGFL